ncbi:MAG: hypothetical protein R6W68_10360 [Ignavibacteriaceae bacterium]
MKRILFILIIFPVSHPAQNLHSPENKKLFADHLFCTKDYLRAIFEYQSIIYEFADDTIEYKIALGFEKINNFDAAAEKFRIIPASSVFFTNAKLHYLKSLIQLEKFNDLSELNDGKLSLSELKLLNLAYLLNSKAAIHNEEFLFTFDQSEREEIQIFYEWKKDPSYKSPFIAGLLSTIIPGSGKIYTGELSEGLTAFMLNGLLGFLSYNNFKNDHNLRGWLFAGAGLFFYTGNIYGSAISANRYNIRIENEYSERIKNYMESKKYYTEEYEFCD